MSFFILLMFTIYVKMFIHDSIWKNTIGQTNTNNTFLNQYPRHFVPFRSYKYDLLVIFMMCDYF